MEKFLEKFSNNSSKWKFISLRYFNPVGSDQSNNFGDNHIIPSNIFPLRISGSVITVINGIIALKLITSAIDANNVRKSK